jgi:hypothetical protein
MKDRQASSIGSDPSGLAHFGDQVRRGIVQSEIEGGVDLEELPAGTRLEVQTENRFYQIVNHGRGRALISGHPTYCPEAVEVSIHGSTWGGRMIKSRFIGRGMHLEFGHPERRGVITTSRIVEIREQR